MSFTSQKAGNGLPRQRSKEGVGFGRVGPARAGPGEGLANLATPASLLTSPLQQPKNAALCLHHIVGHQHSQCRLNTKPLSFKPFLLLLPLTVERPRGAPPLFPGLKWLGGMTHWPPCLAALAPTRFLDLCLSSSCLLTWTLPPPACTLLLGQDLCNFCSPPPGSPLSVPR